MIQHRVGALGSADELSGGEWSRAWKVGATTGDYVFRISLTDEDFEKDDLVGRLHDSCSVLVPIVERGVWGDLFWALSPYVDGVMLDDISGEEMERLLPSFLMLLDVVATLDPRLPGTRTGGPSEGSEGSRLGGGFLSTFDPDELPRLAGWRPRLDDVNGGGLSRHFDVLARTAVAAVEKLPPVSYGLIHGDLLHRNVLTNRDEVVALIDWGCATVGDPLFDYAWLVYWWPWFPQWSDVDVEAAIARHVGGQEGRVEDIERRMNIYGLYIGLDSIRYTAFMNRVHDLPAAFERSDFFERRLG